MRTALLRLLARRPDRTLLRLITATAVLAAVTAFLHWGMARLEPMPGVPSLHPLEGDPAADPRLALRPGPGKIEIGGGRATLASPSPEGTVAVRLDLGLAGGQTGLRLEALVSAEELKPKGGWPNGAQVRLAGFRADGAMLFTPDLQLLWLPGPRPSVRLRADRQLPAGSVRAVAVIEVRGASGRLGVADMRITPLRDRPAFVLLRGILVFAWVLVGGWVVLRLLRHLRDPVLETLLGLLAAGSMVLVLLPNGPRYRLLAVIAGLLGLESANPDDLANWGHVLVFACLALVALWRVRTLPLWLVGLVLAVAAPIAEYVQLLTDGRVADPADAVRNLAGAAVGAGLGLLLRRVPLLAPVLPEGHAR